MHVELLNSGESVVADGRRTSGATTKMDVGYLGFLVRLGMAFYIITGRAFLFDGRDVYSARAHRR